MGNHEFLVSEKSWFSLGLDKTNGRLEKMVVPGGYGSYVLSTLHPSHWPLPMATLTVRTKRDMSTVECHRTERLHYRRR